MIKKVLAFIPFVLCILALYFFFQGKYIWSGSAIIIAGLVNIFVEGLFSEILILAGLLLISTAHKKLLPVLVSILFIVCIYDLTQFCKIRKAMSSDEAKVNQKNWKMKLRERELLHRLVKRIKENRDKKIWDSHPL
jgi:hypothetical protein